MKKIEISEIQPLEKDILFHLLDFFDENSIKFFTSGGTTLGSVRHGGFIPWDDDIDLFLPRKEYDRFLELSNGKLLGGYIEIKKPGDKNYIYPFAKACNKNTVVYEKSVTDRKYAIGIFVDIFPLDTYYENPIKRFFQLAWSVNVRSMLEAASSQINLSKKGSAKWIAKQTARTLQKPLAKALGVEKLAKAIDNHGRKTQNDKDKLVGNVVWFAKFTDFYPSRYFSDSCPGKFEGRSIKNPICYDEYLTRMYGDYMKLPPEDQRVMHGFEAYYLNK